MSRPRRTRDTEASIGLDLATERILDHCPTHAGAADRPLTPRFRLALAVFDTARAVTFETRNTALA